MPAGANRDVDEDGDPDVDGALDIDVGNDAVDLSDFVALDDDDRPVFETPWQARTFAIAVALSEDDVYEWSAFRDRLVTAVERDEGPAVPADVSASEDDHYRRWLDALEELLVSEKALDPAEIERRTRAFAEGERDASEWVDHEHEHEHTH